MVDLTRAQQIGQGLGAFGAGIQGNLPQFQAQQFQQQQIQEEQAQQQVKARQESVIRDADTALSLLDAGNIDGLVAFGESRLQQLSQFGSEDPSGTQRLFNLAVGVKNGSEEAEDLLRAELSSLRAQGRTSGLLEAPKGASAIGKIQEDFASGLINEEQRGSAIAELSAKDLGIVQRFKPDGTADTLLTDDQGNFFTTAGEPVEVDPEDRLIEGSSLTGTAEDLGLGTTEARGLRDAEVSTKTFIATVGDAITLLGETPDVNTFVAGAASIVGNLKQEARAIGRALNLDFDADVLDPGSHSELFGPQGLGIENARMQSLITSLAFQAAAASGQTGRGVSDRDVRRFIREIGASAADPAAFAATLRDVADRTARNFRINFETRIGEEFGGDLGLSNLPTLGGQSTISGDINALSDEELLNF